MKKWSKVLLFIMSLFCIASLAFAEGRIQVGNLKIIPSLGLSGTYDDNIFLGNDDNNDKNEAKESDFITHVKPGIMLDFGLVDRGAVRFGYMPDFAYYSDFSKNNWDSHRLLFDLNYDAPGGLILGINNTYNNSEDPMGSQDQYNVGTKTDRWTNEFRTKMGFNFGGSFRALAYYNYFKQDYQATRDASQDYNDSEFGIGGEMVVLPKTWAFLRYYYGAKDYFSPSAGITETNDADNKWQKVNVGLTWDSGAKFGGELNLGYQSLTYDNAYIAGNPSRDADTWIAATSVNYTATPATNLIFNLSRALRLSGAGTNDYFEDTLVGINLGQQLLFNLMLNAGISYSLNDYQKTDRSDDNYNANLGVNYKIQEWLNAGLAYSYKEKDSTDVKSEYKNNQVEFSLNAVY